MACHGAELAGFKIEGEDLSLAAVLAWGIPVRDEQSIGQKRVSLDAIRKAKRRRFVGRVSPQYRCHTDRVGAVGEFEDTARRGE
jgi:hypothetical protein